MEARMLQYSSSSSLYTALPSGSMNRYRFSSLASSPKPFSVSFTHTKRPTRVLSMSKKNDDDETEKRKDDDEEDETESLNYKDSGVDIDAGAELVRRIQMKLPRIGGFGGITPFDKEYSLVSGMDGVGTKLELAIETGIHETVGIDLVAMNVNDIVTLGAKPMQFLNCFGCSRLDVDLAEKVIAGMIVGCQQSDCDLSGGETAELPGTFVQGKYDLIGCAIGRVKTDSIIDGKNIVVGDVLIGLPSSGVHSNGYSLVRSVLARSNLTLKDQLPGGSVSLGEALMEPTIIYVKQVLDLISKGGVKGIAHITGGGLTENVPRVFPNGLGAVIHTDAWELPPLFKWIQQSGRIEDSEMRRTFNMGIGMVLVVSPEAALRILGEAENGDYVAYRIGEVITGEGVTYQ